MTKYDDNELAKRIGKAMARYRQAKGLTHEEVAERLGIGNEAVSRMERGIVMPTVARLVELADVFQCEASDLLTESSHHPADQAQYLDRLLTQLAGPDRAMAVELVEKLAARLVKP